MLTQIINGRILTPQEAMAAKIPLEKGETDDATAMSYGFIPGVSR